MAKPYKRRPKSIVSYTMSRIRSKGTGIELAMAKALSYAGILYKSHYEVIGKPDFAIPYLKIAIFCDSDFWHGNNWSKRKRRIRANRHYWLPKIERNILRDRQVTSSLKSQGWSVIRFWEHEIYEDMNKCLERIIKRVGKDA